MTNFEFKWLHLSDLHTGLTNQDWLWPSLKEKFFEDFRRLHSKIGGWDLVIFSGDLVQKGSREEFDRFDSVLAEIWSEFDSLGFQPKLITIPGNHDLARPNPRDPAVLLLNKWWEVSEVRQDLFGAESNHYKDTIQRAFAEYVAWTKRLASSKIPTLNTTDGILPGDISVQIPIGDASVGIVGLNSTWLQLGAGDYKGKLHVDTKQLLAVTNHVPDVWVNANDFNVLLTHQPVDWLSRESITYWNSDINPAGRFDVHLYGHMHEPASSSIALGGSSARTSIQAASMFGLTYVGEKEGERIHGYSVARIRVSEEGHELRVWPRAWRRIQSGNHKLGADPTFDLDEDNSYVALERTNLKKSSLLRDRSQN
jgi:predicted MPP superfamily phosphohydrolase